MARARCDRDVNELSAGTRTFAWNKANRVKTTARFRFADRWGGVWWLKRRCIGCSRM